MYFVHFSRYRTCFLDWLTLLEEEPNQHSSSEGADGCNEKRPMQCVHERLTNRLVQDCWREWKVSRLRCQVGTGASSGDLLRNHCTYRGRETYSSELGRNVSGKLLQDEGPQYSNP